MIYGTPAYNLEDDQTDRIGLRRIVYSLMWQASHWPMTQDELDAEAPGIPPMSAGMALVGVQTHRFGGGLRTFWVFEGVHGDGKSVTFKTRGNSPDYSFSLGFSQKSILLKPNILDLIDKYNGQQIDGEIVWPSTLIPTGGAGLAAAAVNAGFAKAPRNPMFGRTDYLDIEGTYSYRYGVFSESQIPVTEGMLFDAAQLPGRARAFPGDAQTKRNYIGAGASYQRRGTIVEVLETYWLSGLGGWPPELYGKGNANQSGNGGGLTTGSLTTGSL